MPTTSVNFNYRSRKEPKTKHLLEVVERRKRDARKAEDGEELPFQITTPGPSQLSTFTACSPARTNTHSFPWQLTVEAHRVSGDKLVLHLKYLLYSYIFAHICTISYTEHAAVM